MRLWPLALAAVAAGLAQAASIALPGDGAPAWWLQLASLAGLAYLLQAVGAAPRRAALLGWLFATSWLCGSFWWLFISMHTYGGMPAPLAGVAVFVLAGLLSLYYAFAAAVHARLAPSHWLWRAFSFAALWLLAELLRGHWFTGFPWGAGGYAHVDGPLARLAPWAGVYGVGAVAAFCAALLAQLPGQVAGEARPGLAMRAGRVAAAACVLAALLVGLDAVRPQGGSTGRLTVALLQGNIAQDVKFEPGSGVADALDWYLRALHGAPAELVVTPETAVPLLRTQLPEGYWDALRAPFAQGQRAALVGIPLGSFQRGYANAVVGLAPGQDEYRYDKHHLVPFGEFVPRFFRWFTALMDIPLGDFHRGAAVQRGFDWKGQRLAPNICYEDLFGEEIGAYFADGQNAPTVLVNMSNIGWFGDTIAIDQHLSISRMRALEFARPMLRATNTGATAIIDADGVVTHLFPRHTRGMLVGEVEGRTGVTPYGGWVSRVGLWPLWALGLLPLLALPFRRRRAA